MHNSLEHIYHLSDDIIPLVHDEYLVIMKNITSWKWSKQIENRTNNLKYDHFIIIFDETP